LAADRSLDLTCPRLAEPNSRLARISAGHGTGKLAAKQSRSKPCGLFSMGALQQMVCRHKISDIDQLKCVQRANRLLGTAKPGHVKSSDQSAAKKTDDGYQGQGYPC